MLGFGGRLTNEHVHLPVFYCICLIVVLLNYLSLVCDVGWTNKHFSLCLMNDSDTKELVGNVENNWCCWSVVVKISCCWVLMSGGRANNSRFAGVGWLVGVFDVCL